jgi:hypothetical protein
MAPPTWWARSVGSSPPALTRRTALERILAMCGIVVAAGLRLPNARAQEPDEDDADLRTEARRSLDMQKQFGWSFGASAEPLTFDGATTQPFDRRALARMPDDLRPARPRHAPFYIPTLFQAPSALPRAVAAGDAPPVVPLERALVPIFTPAMAVTYLRGQALASLFRNAYTQAAVIVDLPGPEAVAFAAGAADVLDPVFLFDNWPHPRGVVPAHLTLAAAAYYEPLFARHAAPPGAPPMFVLDRNRLAPYTDDDLEFDNRYVARVPSAAVLRSIDVTRVLYVTPPGADLLELDDLNDDFVHYAAAGIDVRLVAADAFGPDPAFLSLESFAYADPGGAPSLVVRSAPQSRRDGEERRRYYYGARVSTHAFFWIDYPWIKPAPHGGRMPTAPSFPRPGAHYAPVPRVTPHSSGMLGGPGAPPHTEAFGAVKVVVFARTGAVLGAAASRSGTWGRASGSHAS